jgi:LysM repeat protein
MKNHFFLLAVLLFSCLANAQKKDSLFVKLDEHGWYLPYKRFPGETIFSIARKYHVPPALMADYNHINFQQNINEVLKLQVPIAAYNFTKSLTGETKPLYFRTNSETTLRQIAKTSQISQKTLQEWNNLSSNEIKNNQTLLVGWILYDATSTVPENKPTIPAPAKPKLFKDTSHNSQIVTKPTPPSSKTQPVVVRPLEIPSKDTAKTVTEKIPVVPTPYDSTLNIEGEKLFLEQNISEEFATIERGSAAFFKRAGKTGNGVFYAFHNLAKRGTIIKVTNVGNERVIYARIIGPLPKTDAFYNSIIGISSDARTALDARDEKAWVEIKYAPVK